MGLLDIFQPTNGWAANAPGGFGQQPSQFTQWVRANPYALQAAGQGLQGFFGGMAGATNAHDALVGATKGLNGVNTPAYLQLQLQKRQQDKEAADAKAQQNATVAWIQRNAPQYYGAVAAGVMTPTDAYGQFLQDTTSDKQRAANLERAQGASGLIKDPDLRAAVASGAIGINDALKMESDAAKAAAGGPGDWGSTVMLGRDKNGNAIPLRAAPGGGLSVAAMPDGISFDPGGMAGARTSATVDAKSAAAARQMLPAAEQTVTATLNAIDDVRNNQSGLSDQFGNTFGIPNRVMMPWPGSDRGNLQPAMQQLSGQAFMQARQMLRGGGQITDFEGQKAEMAMARMQSAISNGDEQTYLDALADFEDAVVTGYQKLKAAAQGAYASPDNFGGFSGASGYSGVGGAGDLATMKQRYGLD